MPLRFPRPSRFLEGFFCSRLLPGQFIVGEALAYDLAHGNDEAISVVHVLPVVVAKCLLVDVAKQVERLHGNIGTA
jgi:hypothetical protein